MSSKHPLENLRNIGPSMARHLDEVGIDTEEKLREVGPVEAYARVRSINPKTMNRMALYAIYGALTDQDCMCLPQETKDWLEGELTNI